MNDQNGIEDFIDKIKDYLNTRMKLGKLTLIEKGVLIFANLITSGLVIIFLVLAFLFTSLGLSFYLSELLNNTFAGFFIIAFVYFLVALIAYLVKDKYIEKRIINAMIKKVFKDEEEIS
jgi:hypothetical protein